MTPVISDNIVFPLIEKSLGRELSTSAELRQRMESEQQTTQQVRTTKDAVVNALLQASPEASVMPLNPANDAVQTY